MSCTITMRTRHIQQLVGLAPTRACRQSGTAPEMLRDGMRSFVEGRAMSGARLRQRPGAILGCNIRRIARSPCPGSINICIYHCMSLPVCIYGILHCNLHNHLRLRPFMLWRAVLTAAFQLWQLLQPSGAQFSLHVPACPTSWRSDWWMASPEAPFAVGSAGLRKSFAPVAVWVAFTR